MHGQQNVTKAIEKCSHLVPFVFSKLRDKTYLRFSFDSLRTSAKYSVWQLALHVAQIVNTEELQHCVP